MVGRDSLPEAGLGAGSGLGRGVTAGAGEVRGEAESGGRGEGGLLDVGTGLPVGRGMGSDGACCKAANGPPCESDPHGGGREPPTAAQHDTSATVSGAVQCSRIQT